MNKSTIEAIGICAQAGKPVVIWGPPGVGKSKGMEDLFKNGLQRHLEVVLASLRDPADFGGYPKDVGDRLVFSPPGWAVTVKESGGGVFFDEINTAPPATQAALLRVLLEKKVGDFDLPPDTPMMAAANPPDIAAGGWELAPPTANRFVHLYNTSDLAVLSDTWCDGMLYGFPSSSPLILPENWRDEIDQVKGMVVGFIKSDPTKILMLPTQQVSGEYAFPTPRTWDYVIELLAACQAAKASPEVKNMLVQGTIGRGAAIAFLDYIRHINLPNPEALLADPSSFVMPDRQDILYVIFGSIATRVQVNNSIERFEAAMAVANVAVRKGAAIDIIAGSLARLLRRKPTGAKIPSELFQKLAPLVGLEGI